VPPPRRVPPSMPTHARVRNGLIAALLAVTMSGSSSCTHTQCSASSTSSQTSPVAAKRRITAVRVGMVAGQLRLVT
jgi:hypothetical protein